MLRRIVVTRGHEELRAAWRTRSFTAGASSTLRQSMQVPGMHIDETYHPVRVPGQTALSLNPAATRNFNYESLSDVNRPAAYGVRAMFDDEAAIERAKASIGTELVGVFVDPPIAPCLGTYCGAAPVGTHTKVAQRLGVKSLVNAGLTGKGVRVAIVDTGIDGTQIPVTGGWGPNPSYKPGTTPADHGTMCAFDAMIAAPQASILDYALLQSAGGTWGAFLSDALAAFADLIALLQKSPGPLVVNNSWALFNRMYDAPIGSPENYSANPDHPFNQIVGTLVGAGADVLFAAGNCGRQCPDGRCGAGDKGPGKSIHGANAHPDVITVAAVTVDDRRLGYSSQGPGGLSHRKPDVAGYSHFAGSGVYEADGGTSAASPVVAGVVAALRQRVSVSKLSPSAMKALLQRTATDLESNGWDFDIGYGVVNAAEAVKKLKLTPQTPAKKAAKKAKKATKKATKKSPTKKSAAKKSAKKSASKKSGKGSAKKGGSKKRGRG
jgi:subtilisin family serine protease